MDSRPRPRHSGSSPRRSETSRVWTESPPRPPAPPPWKAGASFDTMGASSVCTDGLQAFRRNRCIRSAIFALSRFITSPPLPEGVSPVHEREPPFAKKSGEGSGLCTGYPHLMAVDKKAAWPYDGHIKSRAIASAKAWTKPANPPAINTHFLLLFFGIVNMKTICQ